MNSVNNLPRFFICVVLGQPGDGCKDFSTRVWCFLSAQLVIKLLDELFYLRHNFFNDNINPSLIWMHAVRLI